jgi:hypothetical protein
MNGILIHFTLFFSDPKEEYEEETFFTFDELPNGAAAALDLYIANYAEPDGWEITDVIPQTRVFDPTSGTWEHPGQTEEDRLREEKG